MSRKDDARDLIHKTLDAFGVAQFNRLDRNLDRTFTEAEQPVADALDAFLDTGPTKAQMLAVATLLDKVLSKALHRDPAKPWAIGASEAADRADAANKKS